MRFRKSTMAASLVLAGLVSAMTHADPEAIAAAEPRFPLSFSAIMVDRRVPRLPPSVSHQTHVEIVKIRAMINAGGGVRSYEVVGGGTTEYVELARRAFLESRFSAPALSHGKFEGVGHEACVPWGQGVVLTYTFVDDGDRFAKLEQEFDGFAGVSAADAAKVRAWNASEGVVPSSNVTGFTDLKPVRRPAPRFPKSAFDKLYASPVGDPQVMHISMRIDPSGKPGSVLVLGDGEFAPYIASVAQSAIKNWRFEPARIDGVAVARVACQKMKFEMTMVRG